MADARSAYSARPSSLANPVPDASFETGMADLLASPVPETPALNQQAQGGASFEQGLADLTAGVPPASAQGPQLQAINRDEGFPGFEDIRNKVVSGLAANGTEMQAYLRKQYGDENVRVDNIETGELSWRRTPSDKWKRLDNESLGAIGNFVLGRARDIVTETAMLPGEVLGGTAGFLAGTETGPGALVTGAWGAQAGRIASVPIANKIADKVAEFAGVPQDPNRSRGTENAIGMGAEVALPIAGRYVAKAAKYIPGTEAYALAKRAGAQESIALSAQSREVVEAMQALPEREMNMIRIDGEQIGVPGANVTLMGHEMHPDSPDLARLSDQARPLAKFINATNARAEGWSQAVENNLREAANLRAGRPIAPEHLQRVLTNAVEDLETTEGKAIGKYRTQAIRQLANNKLPVNDTLNQQAASLMRELGVTVRPVKETVYKKVKRAGQAESNRLDRSFAQPNYASAPGATTDTAKFAEVYARKPGRDPGYDYVPTTRTRFEYTLPDELKLGRLGITDRDAMRSFLNVTKDFADTTSNGVRIQDIDRLTKRVGNLNKAAAKQGGEIQAAWGKFSSDLRAYRREVIRAGLDTDVDRKGFDTTMDNFGLIRDNMEKLTGVLKDDASAKAVVGNIFTGKENLPRIRAVKALVMQQNPEVWSALKEEWVNQQLVKHASTSTTTPYRYDAGKLLSTLDRQYGPEFVREVLDAGDGANAQTVRNLLKVGQRMQEMYKMPAADKLDEKVKKGMMDTTIGLLADIKFKSINGVMALVGAAKDREHPLFEIMTRDGIDKYVAAYPGRIDKKSVSQNLHDMLARYRVMRALGAERASVAKEVAGRGAKAQGRNAPINSPAQDIAQP
jgi:hypothetical protein